ncbi:signal peptidase I [Microlunatus capsulatus]|uniref:Signal peptidase I n=1 Tax=Microlunatus capsulatus TaxID=99117 RepID=A0ABS4Z9A4_9ACTN|nr:signal peptidase I [Microlunatus capsulatus]MBP2417345.1 signal peptidase I [Microlunatus capsulatus]
MRWRAVVAVVAVLGGVAGARLSVLDPVRVSSGSMEPTVCTGDVVVVNHLAPRGGVDRGDVVTFASPVDGTEQIKRVVAVAGQQVGIADALLVVDGRVVAEPYVDPATIDGVYFGPVLVPEGTVFVMGDARELSVDSRAFGPVPLDAVDGRLSGRLWSSC